MALKGFFYNSVNKDRLYNGQDMNEDKAPFYKEGVVFGHLAVEAVEGMTIKVDGGKKTGYAYINMHTIHNTTAIELQVGQASGNFPRIDRVVLRNDETERKPSIYILEGNYSSDPSPKELTNTEAIQEKCLAEIYVSAGAVEITQADIKDTRADADLCGFIASQFNELNFELFAMQFNAWFTAKKEIITEDYENFIREYKELKQSFIDTQELEWNEWFSGLQDYFAKTESGKLLEEIRHIYEKICDIENNLFGDADISGIGDGTVTGALSALNSSLNGLSFVVIAQSEYDALPEKDPNTVYFRKEG